MLTYTPSTIAVFQTEDYNQFTLIKGNRPLNQKKIKKIIAEIESGNDMLRYYPIQVKVVEDKLRILDGQHRCFICQKLKRPVYFILVTEEKSMQDIAKVNSNVEKWKDEDFINCYINTGNKNYELIDSYRKEFGFAVGICLKLLNQGEPGNESGTVGTLLNSFQQGTFDVNYYDDAVKFGNIIKLFSAFKNHRQRSFVIAIYRVLCAKKIDINDLAKAYEKNPALLKEQANFKDYIINLEQIMNVGKHSRIIIT